MNPAEMIVAIVMIVVIGRIIQMRYNAHGAARPSDDAVEARQLRDEVRVLKERIQVLERLATDDNSSVRLDREIEALRDRTSERTRHDD